MKFESLIFDIDGTLWDSRALVAEGYNIQLKAEGLEHLFTDAEALRPLFGKVMTEIGDVLFASVPQQDGTALDIWYFISGKKTKAGKDRIVIVPDKILPFILERIFIPGTDLVFPQYQFSKTRSPVFMSFKKMDDSYFRETAFKPMMTRLHIADGKVPYGARHTFADKLKYADGSDKDKASLMGHTKYVFTQSAYQSSHLADLKKLVESIPK